MTKQINASPAMVFTYSPRADDQYMTGLAQFNSAGAGPDYNAMIFLRDSVALNLRTEKTNAKNLIHEAYHGFARSTNEDSASAAETRCVL